MITVVLMLVLIGWMVADHRKAMSELTAIRNRYADNANGSH